MGCALRLLVLSDQTDQAIPVFSGQTNIAENEVGRLGYVRCVCGIRASHDLSLRAGEFEQSLDRGAGSAFVLHHQNFRGM